MNVHLQFKFLAVAVILAIIALWLEGCNYAIIESSPVHITWTGNALAEEAEGFIGRGRRDADGETAVKEIQTRLVALGYLNEAPDGIFGKNTQGALLRFQAENKLPESGVVDYATQYRLFSAMAAPAPMPEPKHCKRGATGDQVQLIQKRMQQYGFYTEEADGNYSRSLENAVKAFQDYAVEYFGADFDVPGSSSVSGQTAENDYAGYGEVSVQLYTYLAEDLFDTCHVDVKPGDSGHEIQRIQNRLVTLGYLVDHEPGVYDSFTENALYWFQGRNNLGKTGTADPLTRRKLFSEAALSPEPVSHPNFMRVSLDEQKVYVYRWVCGDYNLLIKTMICSTGKAGWETPKGLFHSSGHAGDRWHHFEMNDTYGQYAFNINGNILFHSVLYDEADENTLQKHTLDALGTPASHGCVRLTVDDAYWIYWNNKPGAPIEVY